MADYKATYKGSYTDRYDKRYTTLFYEYRGHEYMIEKANSWTGCSSDYTIWGSKSLAAQHREAQEGIDAMIERESRHEEPAPYTGAVEKALDLFWAYLEE